MTDFVSNYTETGCLLKEINKIRNYANFLKQPLELEMFVPCVNREPFNHSKHGNVEQYEKAKEKVLFKDFTVLSERGDVIELECKDIYINYNKEEDLFFLDSWNDDALIMNIECLADLIKHTASTIKLTEKAIKTFKR